MSTASTIGNVATLGLFGGNDPTSATNNGTFGPGGYKVGDIAYEGLAPGQDSITQYFRSFENAQAKTGQAATATGDQGYAAGQAGLAKSQTDLQPSIDYFTKLLGGNRAAVTNAAQPQIDQIGDQFNQVRQMTSLNPRGGGSASASAQSPTQQIAQITTLLNQLRGTAATGLTAATGQEASTAGAQGQLGQGEQNLGLQDMNSAIQSVESRKGFNVQESDANKSTATSLFSSLV